ncbi:hypothetical protein CsSME_00036401 [Camellia sinensis var. sinensis]
MNKGLGKVETRTLYHYHREPITGTCRRGPLFILIIVVNLEASLGQLQESFVVLLRQTSQVKPLLLYGFFGGSVYIYHFTMNVYANIGTMYLC